MPTNIDLIQPDGPTVVIGPVISGKKATNADRIRSMADEELVELLTEEEGFCCPVRGVNCLKELDCQECFARWLKQEADE